MPFMRVLNLLLVVLLAGCRLPSLLPHAATPLDGTSAAMPAHVLQGRIVSPPQVQASLTDIASFASIALIDSETGYTAATTVSGANGTFTLRFEAGFSPVDGRAYYLDAIKGIKETGPATDPNPLFNQAGADAVRLRTVLFHQSMPEGWVSLKNAAPGAIYISRGTTAIAMAVFLKQQSQAIAWSSLIGALHVETDAYTEVPASLTSTEFQDAYAIVDEAITQHRDPLQFLAFDSAVGFVNLYNGHSVDSLEPDHGAINQQIVIKGDGFLTPGDVTVTFNTTETVPPTGANRTKDRLVVTVPPGARTGPVLVKIGTVTQAGPAFTVDSYDGHRAKLGDTLYVANFDRAKIVKVSPDGVVEDFADVPAGPTQLAIYTDDSDPLQPIERLFVACETADQIVTLDLREPAPIAQPFVNLTKPAGLAFLGNVLYVSSKSLKTVSRFNLDKSSAGDALTGFEAPAALAFDFESQLFVADGNKVLRVNLTTGTSLVWIYLSSPRGLSVDSGGTLYVANYDDGVIYRILVIPPTNRRAAYVFARVPNPTGIMLDAAGYMFAASETQHQISRISPLGDMKPYAYGIANPRGLAVDGAGNLYVSLSQSNAVLKVEQNGSYRTRPFVTGIPNPHSITWRNDKLYLAHRDAGVVSSATAAGSMKTEAVGFTMPGGADVAADGTIFAGRYGASWHLEVWPPDPTHVHYNRGGLESYANGVISLDRGFVRTSLKGLVGLDDGTRYVLTSQNTLLELKATNGPSSSYRYRQLDAYAQTPLRIERDGAGNHLYVLLEGSKDVLRYEKLGDSWVKSVLDLDPALDKTGFTNPTRMTFDAAGDRLYVLDGGVLKRVEGATTATPALSTKAPGELWSVSLTGANSISYKNSRIYVTYGNTWIRSLDSTLASPTVSDYAQGPVNLTGVIAHPVSDYLFAYQGEDGYKVPPSGVFEYLTGYGGTAFAYTPDGTFMRDYVSYMPLYFGKTTLPGLVQTHEVAVDGDRVYVGSSMNDEYTGVYRFDRDTGEQWLIRGLGSSGASAIAVGPDRTLYVGGGNGKIYQVDGNGAASAAWVTTPAIPSDRLYGLDITANGTKLWAIGSSRTIYGITVAGKTVELVKPGLSSPRF